MGLAFPGGLTGSQRHVARPRDSPLIVSREQDSTDQAGSGDADDLGDALDLTIPSSSGLAGWILGRWSLGSS
jgi:hypothetical protein